jgi:catalase
VKVFKEENRAYLVNAMAKSMGKARPDIKARMIKVCSTVHPDFGERLAKALDFNPNQAKL